MMSLLLAAAYCVILVGVIGFQIALIAGAPWGRLTQGGTHDGALPASGRIAAFLSIGILIGLGLAMLSQAGQWPAWPRWAGWVAVGIHSMVTAANWATRSKPERRLWAPITSVMLALVLAVMLL